MADDPPTMAEQVTALSKELAQAKSISGGGHEPAYYYLVDPPGKAVVEAFLRERQPGVPAKDQPLPFFCVELPPLPPDGPPLVHVLSRALGLSMRGKWKDPFFVQ